MGSCAAPSAKGDDKFITTDYLQQCRIVCVGQSPSGCGKALLRGHADSSREGFDSDSTEGAKDFRCRFIRSSFALF
ncbi:hypothetical protein FH501_13180 [Klebsiella pneumoniae]|nr:hypothetical protein FH501_13180 [Klebsiella pneumoniae]